MAAAKRFAASVSFALAALAASGFHVQFGYSGWSSEIAQQLASGNTLTVKSPWICTAKEIGATPSRVTGVDLRKVYYKNGISAVTTSPRLEWRTYNDTFTLTDNSSQERFIIAETSPAPSTSKLSYGLLTVRGDPYSVVMNDTDTDRTVNGVLIKSGQCAYLPFPMFIETSEIPNVHFYALDTGNEIQPMNLNTAADPKYYYGYYKLMWTGDIRISDGTHSPTNKPTFEASPEPLVYGDMVAANANKILFAANNMPIYSSAANKPIDPDNPDNPDDPGGSGGSGGSSGSGDSNVPYIAFEPGELYKTGTIRLRAEWVFDDAAWGIAPKAVINGNVVCEAHTTAHIVAYKANVIYVISGSGTEYAYLNMSQTPDEGYSGGDCTMRCWDSRANSYDAASPTHRAEVSAGTGTAYFIVTIYPSGEWTLTSR